MWVQGLVDEVLGVKKIRILVEIFFFHINFVGLHLLSSKLWAGKWTSVRNMAGLILKRKCSDSFNFYSIF